MKKILLAAAFIFSAILSAAEISVDLSKVKVGDKKVPGFGVNAMGKYEGLGSISIVEGSQEGKKAINLVTTSKRSTSYFAAAATKAKAGDTVKITAKVKGTGKVSFGFYAYAASGFVPAGNPHKTFALTDDYQDVVYEMELLETKAKNKDGNVKAIASIRLVFTGAPNSNVTIEDLKMEVIAK